MDVYVIATEEIRKISETFCAEHFPQRMNRAKKFLRKEDRLLCMGAGVLLHVVLGLAEEDIYLNEYGKPLCKNSKICFNLSHGGDYAVLAADSDTVGIDVEKISEKHVSVAEKVFTEEELQWMRAEPLNRFCTLWTLKESAVKATGRGLGQELSSFCVLPALEGEPFACGDKKLFGSAMALGDHILSVCSVEKHVFKPKFVTAEEPERT